MSKGITRRALIAGGAFTAASAMLGAGMVGCSPTASDGEAGSGGAAGEVRTYPTHIHETDVLVVGGGYSGCMAAYRALQLGANVTILDKAQFGHSGTSGYNWGSMYQSYDFATDLEGAYTGALMAKIRAGSGVCDQNITNAVIQTMFDEKPTLLMESLGAFHERLEDGTAGTCNTGVPLKDDKSQLSAGMYNRFICQKVKRMGAVVHDRTMLLDVLVDESNVAAGGIALDLKQGEIHVYRAKSVIMATGSYNWLCGWTGWRPQSMVGPECTGDGYSILMKRGVPIGNMEFVTTDFDAWNPGCFRDAYVLGLEYPDMERGVNSEGENFALDYITAHPDQGGIETLTQLVAGEVYHGRGSEHGGVWLDTTNWGGQEMELFYRVMVDDLKRNFDYKAPDKVEVVPDHWASHCQPQLTEDMQTSIPGLFFAGYATMSTDVTGCMASGSIAGRSGALRATTTDFAAIDWSQVNEVVDHTYGLLESEPKDGITATQIMHSINYAYRDGLDMLREEKGIQAALEELKRIQKEDLPKMCVPNKTRVFNLEWRHALEAEHMLDCAIGIAMATLERRESRFHHVRTDYPALDNANYLKCFMISKEGDEFRLTPRDVDMSIVDAATMDFLVANTNINSYHNER